jgi:hypothetical protein
MNKPSPILLFPPYGRMARISRPKLFGLGRHEGVLLPDGRVVHTSADGGTQLCAYGEFKSGHVVQVEHELPIPQHRSAIVVLNALLAANTPYDLITNNCEIFSRRVVLEEPKSPQVGFWAVAALCMAAWFVSQQKVIA